MGLQRLQKIIAAAGIASRRKAEVLITAGKVTVNGQVVRELGSKADSEKDHIKVNGKLLARFPEKIYLLLNKPRGCLCAVADPRGRSVVTELVAPYRGLYPVGRLDYNSEGLLLMTNDGEFARIVTQAGGHCPKTYQVKVRGTPAPERLEKLRRGTRLPDGVHLAAMDIETRRQGRESRNTWLQVRLYEGKNNQIRKMFKACGHPVVKLRRTAIGFLEDRRLKPGQHRLLSPHEVTRFLSMASPDAAAHSGMGRRPGSETHARPRERRHRPPGAHAPRRPGPGRAGPRRH